MPRWPKPVPDYIQAAAETFNPAQFPGMQTLLPGWHMQLPWCCS